MALSSHLLKEAVLYRAEESDTDKEHAPTKSAESLAELQSQVLNLASKIFSGAYEVNYQTEQLFFMIWLIG